MKTQLASGRVRSRARTAIISILGASSLALVAAPASAQAGGGVSANDGGGSGGHTFPVRGRHTYGDGFGAGRGHKGQDLLANCRKDVVAARGGRVKVVDYEAGGAGNYVVIRGKRTGRDYVYMHMLDRIKVRRGERVQTGETIGLVGSTGSSTACHLHFELWDGGWYSGGRPLDPTRRLRRWDRSN